MFYAQASPQVHVTKMAILLFKVMIPMCKTNIIFYFIVSLCSFRFFRLPYSFLRSLKSCVYSFNLMCYACSSSLLSLSVYLDFALTKVSCSSGNGSIISSNLLAKCLPCNLSAIQSSLGLASACCRVKFHMSMMLRELLRNTL